MQKISIKSLLTTISAGLIIGLLTLIVEISFATLIFSGPYAAHLNTGIGIMLLSATLVGIVFSFATTSPGMIARPHEIPAAILAVMASSMAASFVATHPGGDPFPSLVGLMVVSALVTALVFLAMGRFRLGSFIRFIPYPVVGGFLAGTGWLLLLGGLGVMSGEKIGIATLPRCLEPGNLLLCSTGLLMGAVLYFLNRRYKVFWLMPAVLFGAILLFWGAVYIGGFSAEAVRSAGWLLPDIGGGRLLDPFAAGTVVQADWMLVASQAPGILTILVMSIIPLLLNASSYEMVAGRDVDINGELKAAGAATLISAVAGGPAAFHTLSLSALAFHMGAATRSVGCIAAGVSGLVLILGPGMLTVFPRPVLGGMLAFQGISFLVEWVADARRRLPVGDWFLVQTILVVIALFGFLPGVAVGVCIALILFVITYSRVDVVKYMVSGQDLRSNVDRNERQCRLLDEQGASVVICRLQGFLFFGTAYFLVRRIRERLDASGAAVMRFLILDFSDVSGMDSSALNSFVKMRQTAAVSGFRIVLSAMPPSLRGRFGQTFGDDDATMRMCKDLDRAMEWCEDRLVEAGSLSDKDAAEDIDLLLMEIFADVAAVEQFRRRLVMSSVPAGGYLMREGDPPLHLHFIEKGFVTAKLARETGPSMRLRTMGPGTVVGELGFYLNRQASASVKAETDATIWSLSASGLRELEREDPAAAASFHRWIIRLLGGRLTNTNNALRAMRD